MVSVAPGFANPRMTKEMQNQTKGTPDMGSENPEYMARRIVEGVEKSGISVMSWPMSHTMMMNAFKGMNPICEELGRWLTLKSGISSKKIA